MVDNKKWILYITIPLLLIVLMICITLIVNMYHPFVFRFEMDNNTKDALRNINYGQIDYNQNKYLDSINYSGAYFKNVSVFRTGSICGNKTYHTVDNKYCGAEPQDMIQCFRCD